MFLDLIVKFAIIKYNTSGMVERISNLGYEFSG